MYCTAGQRSTYQRYEITMPNGCEAEQEHMGQTTLGVCCQPIIVEIWNINEKKKPPITGLCSDNRDPT